MASRIGYKNIFCSDKQEAMMLSGGINFGKHGNKGTFFTSNQQCDWTGPVFLHAFHAIYINPPTPQAGSEDLWGLLLVVTAIL